MKGTLPAPMQTVNNAQKDSESSVLELLTGYLQRPTVLLPSLGLLTLVLYSGTLFFEFVWDDWPQIVNNPLIRSWRHLPRAFGTDLWYHVARQQVYYRPFFVVWSMLNFTLFALRPWGWHLGAILMHVGAVLAVFWMVRKLGLEYWTAALAALIFALHPVHIEPAAWISAASDSMVTMLAALSFAAFLNWRETDRSHRTAWRIASLGLLACALLTKEMALPFAVLVGIYVWLNPTEKESSPGRKLYEAAREVLPYVLVTLAYLFVRKYALQNATAKFDTTHGMLVVFRTLPMVLSVYLEKLLLPLDLTGLYYTPYVVAGYFRHVMVPAGTLAAVAAALWYWCRRAKDPLIAFAGWWLLIGLAPALYLPGFADGDFVRDRYMYLPSIGFVILAAKALRQLPAIYKWHAKIVQLCAVSALCLFYVLASLSQQVQWGSDFLQLIRAQQLYPGNPYTMVGLAAEYSRRGAHEEAIAMALRAAQEHPEYVYTGLGVAETYIRAGRREEGRLWVDRALQVYPDFVASETGKAALAGLYGRLGDYDRALFLCDQVLAQDPDLYSALFSCGNVHLMAGQYPQAERLLRRAVAVNPGQDEPEYYLGRALLGEGKTGEAESCLRAAVTMDATVWTYHYWLAVALEQGGDALAARAQYLQALQLNPGNMETRQRLVALETKYKQ